MFVMQYCAHVIISTVVTIVGTTVNNAPGIRINAVIVPSGHADADESSRSDDASLSKSNEK